MNTVTSVAPVIAADRDALRRDFPYKPFAIRHRLAGHPLLMLPRIAQLAAELPRDLIEYNSGKVAISQDPDAIPSVDLDPVEIVRRIETAGAWMVLKRKDARRPPPQRPAFLQFDAARHRAAAAAAPPAAGARRVQARRLSHGDDGNSPVAPRWRCAAYCGGSRWVSARITI